MHNTFTIETEAAHRRQEWERAVAVAAQIAQARRQNGWTRRARLPQRVLADLRSLFAPRVPITCSRRIAAEERVATLKGGHATVI